MPLDPDALLAGHALGDLDAQEAEQLRDLLARDPALRQRLDQFQTTLELLPLGLAADPQPSPRRPRRGPWLALLCALAAAALGLELQQTRLRLASLEARPQDQPLAAAPAAAVRHLPLRAVAATLPASGEVMVTGNGIHNVLMLRDLPAPPPGHLYRLWADVDGRRIGCVAFAPTDQGRVGLLIPAHPTTEARSVSVSLETSASGTAPAGPTLLRSLI